MNYCELTALETAQKLNTNTKTGLSEKEARKRLIKNGKNELKKKKRTPILVRFIKQFEDFMIVVLLCAAAVSFVTSLLLGDKDITEPVIILAIVFLNATLSVIQEMRAEHSLEALKKLSSPTATVIRDGHEMRINSDGVVKGDIIKFRQGDMVCADVRLFKANNLTVDESHLTGEAAEITKDADIIHEPLTPTGDIKNMCFASSSITAGEGMAIVVRTGMDTEVGKIASLLSSTPENETPMQKRLSYTGRTLGYLALFICAIIFVIGIVRNIAPLEMFMTSVSLAVAAIPEGLPAIVTILLALGVIRMSKKNAIVRNLPSVETLGSATVICTDKTGTLTQNKMKVAKVKTEDVSFLYKLVTLCSEDGDYINPTDKALIEGAQSYGIDTRLYKKSHPKKDAIPFSSSRKMMSVLADDKVIVKGALEYILPLCTHTLQKKGISPIGEQDKRKIIRDNNEMTQNALRVIAVAYRGDNYSDTIKENNLVFAGLIGIYDPPRPEAENAVRSAKEAGIRTVMITGDHANTAIAIARRTGIAAPDEKAVLGTDIDKASDSELSALCRERNVFARVTPEHKLRIVNTLKAQGEICAMTGDGVNDAPALKGADIGCSMGINGTDVAKSASDIILTDDNFATIVYAVREGRIIYDNIKKSIKFLLSSNIGEILTVLFSILLGFAAPLTATELLWINLVTDSLPAIALGLDAPDKNIMLRPPENTKKGFFGAGLWASITLEGLMIGALSLVSYTIGLNITKDVTAARTMSFTVLSLSQLTHAFNMRSERAVIDKELFKNKLLVFSFITGLFMQLVIIYLPPISNMFSVCALSPLSLAISLTLSLMPLFIVELQKRINFAVSGRK